MKLRERFARIIPRHVVPWLFLVPITHFVVYFGTKLLVDPLPHYTITSALDRQIPFVPVFILPYVMAYLFWVVNYILIARESPAHCKRVLTGEMISKLICLLFFLLLPTTMERPELSGSGPMIRLCRLIYAADTPTNLFPSIHCLDSWLCWRGLFGSRKVPKWYKTFSLIFALLICVSTVLVKQHVLIDILGGILTGELGLLASRLIYRKKKER